MIPSPFNYTGYPLPTIIQTTNPALPNYLPPQGITNGFISQPYNVRGGKMYGAELAATLPLGEFVPLLDGVNGRRGGIGNADDFGHGRGDGFHTTPDGSSIRAGRPYCKAFP